MEKTLTISLEEYEELKQRAVNAEEKYDKLKAEKKMYEYSNMFVSTYYYGEKAEKAIVINLAGRIGALASDNKLLRNKLDVYNDHTSKRFKKKYNL